MVGGLIAIYNFQCIFVDHLLPEVTIPLHPASLIPLSAVGVEFTCMDGAALSNDSLPV
jgi:hypothetical protein